MKINEEDTSQQWSMRRNGVSAECFRLMLAQGGGRHQQTGETDLSQDNTKANMNFLMAETVRKCRM